MIEEFEKSKKIIEQALSKINADNSKYFSEYEEYLDLSLEDLLGREKLIDSLLKDKRSIKRSIDEKNKEISTLKSQAKTNSCHLCNQKLPSSHWEKNLVKVIRLEEEVKELEVSKNDIKIPDPYPISSQDYSSVLALKDLVSKKKIYEGQIEEYNSKLSESRNKKIEFNKKYEIMRFWEKAFSEQGIIKYIIRNVLSYFNDRINYYLSFLTNDGYYLEFDEELSEKILVSDEEVHYISLSGGEKRKINLSVLLALRDLLSLTDKNQLDIIFFDEVAENLDEEGIQGLHLLLNEIKKTKNVFVITHNKHLKTLLDSSPRITIIKTRGESKIIGKDQNGNNNSG